MIYNGYARDVSSAQEWSLLCSKGTSESAIQVCKDHLEESMFEKECIVLEMRSRLSTTAKVYWQSEDGPLDDHIDCSDNRYKI